MNRSFSTRLQLACAWAGPLFLVSYGIFFWGVAGYIPPTDPIAGADEIAAFYEANRTEIRIGMLGGLVASTLLFPFFTLISIQIARIERPGPPILAAMQWGGAVLLLVFFAVCSMLWVTATFRSELDPASIRQLHDLSWLVFVMVFPAYTMQMICQAIAGFIDKSAHPTWPRWAAYFNLWVGFAGMGGGLAVFFKEGAFAWNGLIGFYVPLTVFAVWVIVTTTLLVKAVKRQATNEPAEDLTLGVPEPERVHA